MLYGVTASTSDFESGDPRSIRGRAWVPLHKVSLASVAQLAERMTVNHKVLGSKPSGSDFEDRKPIFKQNKNKNKNKVVRVIQLEECSSY